MIETDIRAAKAYDTVSQANKEAYKDIFMMSNPVLSKNPSNNGFLSRCLSKDVPKKPSRCIIAYKVVLYYIKSLAHFLLYLSRFIESAIASLPNHLDRGRDELILIDVPFICDSINGSGSFNDIFFPGLERVLKEKGKHYAYLPFFYSSSCNKRPLEILRALKVLKKDDVKAVTEYQLLSARDILQLAIFILTYPLHVFAFSKTLLSGADESVALKYELMNTIDQVTFYNYVRYLMGKRISDMSYKQIKIISCYENQAMNKNLYRGARSNGNKKVTILGSQLFLHSKYFISMLPDENEGPFGVLPEKVIVNGPYYIPEAAKIAYEVGPSLRYAGIFSSDIKRDLRKDILVLLPYFADDSRNLLQVLLGLKCLSGKIFIKAHPSGPLDRISHLIPPGAEVVQKGIYELFKTAKIVIGAASGTMIEAASIGIPVISIRNSKRFEWNNPLPEYGKGVIWEEAVDAEGLGRQIERFEKNLKERPSEINAVAERYKEMFFCKPTDEKIVKAFEL